MEKENDFLKVLYKVMSKTKTRKKYKKKGGKVIASGGYGCVFRPMLKCTGTLKRTPNTISKLMTKNHAIDEYNEILRLNKLLTKIPNYKDYFLIYGTTICKPAALSHEDLESYNHKCSALPKDDITKKNINTKLDKLMMVNIPDGGLPVDDYIYSNGSYPKIYKVYSNLIDLLKNGIIPMNEHRVYHSDIKDSNVLIDGTSGIARLIDWGLTVEYNPTTKLEFPHNWKNRPLQFNVPFSVILFTDAFNTKYTAYLKKGGKTTAEELTPFVTSYLKTWMKYRGFGHYKLINEIMYMLHSNKIKHIPMKQRPDMIEKEITVPTIVNYIVDVLVHYTKFKEDGSLNLREYLDDVYIKIVDIYGFINIYFPLLEMLFNNYSYLNNNELNILTQIEVIFNEYLYKPRHEPINMTMLFKDLNEIGTLLNYIKTNDPIRRSVVNSLEVNVPKTDSNMVTTELDPTKMMNKTSPTQIFKRKYLNKRFKNPKFVSTK